MTPNSVTSSTVRSARNTTALFSPVGVTLFDGPVKKAVDAGIKVAVFDTAVSGEIPGVTVSQQDDASLTDLSFGQLVKDFNGKANIIKLWVAGFPPMERRQAAYQTLLKQNPGIKELESIGAVSSDAGRHCQQGGAIRQISERENRRYLGHPDAFSRGPIRR